MKFYHRNIRRGALAILMGLALAACGSKAAAPADAQPTAPVAAEAAEPTAAQESAPTEAPAVEPTAAPAQPLAPAGGGMACFASFDTGIACLTDSGWTYYNEESGLGSGTVSILAACPNGNLLSDAGLALSAFDGQTWQSVSGDWVSRTPAGIACDANGGYWVTYYGGAQYFNGSEWTEYAAADLASGDSANELIGDVAVAPDGVAWVQTANSIAAFKDGAWTVYQQGSGFENVMYFSGLALDAQGRPWAAAGDSLAMFDGSAWQIYPLNNYLSIEALTVDARGRVYLATFDSGVYVFENGLLKQYTMENGLGSNYARSLAVDASGRVWAGTTYGLSVFDGAAWTTYRMDNTDLHDNDIRSIVVTAAGPVPPAVAAKATGSITGVLTDASGAPLANSAVEICVENVTFFETTPCDGQPFVRQTTTGADGGFAVTDLPAGLYVVAANLGESWATLTDSYGFVSQRVFVAPGEENNLGSLQQSAE